MDSQGRGHKIWPHVLTAIYHSLLHCSIVGYYSCILYVFVFALGPFTRPHPAIWRIVFGK